jgi:hypothetical protein
LDDLSMSRSAPPQNGQKLTARSKEPSGQAPGSISDEHPRRSAKERTDRDLEPDQATATGWLDDADISRRHQNRPSSTHQGHYMLAYDAARKSVAAALLMSGHRVLSRPGSHQALAQYVESIAIQVDEPAPPASIGSDATATDPSTDQGPSARPKSLRPSTRQKPFLRAAPALSESGLLPPRGRAVGQL